MLVNESLCVGCNACAPYCPMGCMSLKDGKMTIDQNECVECEICRTIKICPVNALEMPELEWPRSLRNQFSNPTVPHPKTNVPGRGTEEMKTNDVTGRFKRGRVGMAAELGRPGTGAFFVDVEKVMSHTLHRKGTEENLKHDYVVFAIAAQSVNAKGSIPKFARFFEMAKKYNPDYLSSLGDMKTGNIFHVGLEAIENGFRENSIVHAVFTDSAKVAEFLSDLKEEDLGLSIVVSGLMDQTADCCHKSGIAPHTQEHSMGIWGKTSLLPEDEVLEISTMCGHGMIAFGIIKKQVEMVKAGKISAEKAAESLAKLCHCGVFNPDRAAEIIKLMAK